MKINIDITHAEWKGIQAAFWVAVAALMVLCYIAFVHERPIDIYFDDNLKEIGIKYGCQEN